MRLLLDTHVFIWAADSLDHVRLSARGPGERSRTAETRRWCRRPVRGRSRRSTGSVASTSGGRIVADWPAALAQLRAVDLAVTSEHGLLAGGFPAGHGDPFDRMLAAQAIVEGAHLVTTDRAMAAFGAEVLW